MILSDNPATLRHTIALAALAILLGWETVQPFLAQFPFDRSGLRARAGHGARNLGFGILNTVLTVAVFVGWWNWVTDWATRAGFGLLNLWPLPSAGRWLLVLLLLDWWTYTWHRLNHRVPWLWRFHRLHHSDRQMNVTTAGRFHVMEIALSSLLRVPLLALLGARLEELAVYETLLFAVVQFHHANVGLPEWLDRRLRWIIVTPALHKVHHSVRRAEADSNYSSLFSWWDRWFGTWKLLAPDRQIEFGVED